MLTYLEWKRLDSSYYRSALEYFDTILRKDNEDLCLTDVEFKYNEIIISYEDVEKELYYYEKIKIEDFINFHKENLNKYNTRLNVL